jgi:hypothetical protein
VIGSGFIESGSSTSSESESRILMTKNGKELKKNFLFNFLDKNCNLLIPRPPPRTSKVQEKPLQPSKQGIQHFLDPNPETPLNSESIRIRIHNTAGKCWNTSY